MLKKKKRANQRIPDKKIKETNEEETIDFQEQKFHENYIPPKILQSQPTVITMPSNINERAIMDKFDDKIKKIEEQLNKISENFLNSQKNKEKSFQKRIKKELDQKMNDIDKKLVNLKDDLWENDPGKKSKI